MLPEARTGYRLSILSRGQPHRSSSAPVRRPPSRRRRNRGGAELAAPRPAVRAPCGQRQHRRTGAGQHRRYPATAAGTAGIPPGRHGRGPLRLVQHVLGGRHQQIGALGECHHQQRGPADVEPGVGVAHLLGQQHPGLGGGGAHLRDGREQPDVGVQRAAARRRRSARVRGAGRRSRTPPRHRAPRPRRCRGGPRTPRPAGSAAPRVSGDESVCASKAIRDRQAADDRRRRGAEPAGVRDGVAAAHDQARRVGIRLPPGRGGWRGPPGGRAPVGTCPAPSPSTSMTQPAVGGLDHDLVVEAQRQAEAVEAGAEVGTGCRDRGAARSARRAGSCDHRAVLSPARARPPPRPGRPAAESRWACPAARCRGPSGRGR